MNLYAPYTYGSTQYFIGHTIIHMFSLYHPKKQNGSWDHAAPVVVIGHRHIGVPRPKHACIPYFHFLLNTGARNPLEPCPLATPRRLMGGKSRLNCQHCPSKIRLFFVFLLKGLYEKLNCQSNQSYVTYTHSCQWLDKQICINVPIILLHQWPSLQPKETFWHFSALPTRTNLENWWYIYIYLYVYICLSVCLYVCMYVCVHVWFCMMF